MIADRTKPFLEVAELSVEFPTQRGVIRAADAVSFAIAPGETVGLVGESGSGKSVTARSLMGLVDAPGRIVGGAVRLGGDDLLAKSEREMLYYRGQRMAMVFQEPADSLDPTSRVGAQLLEALKTDVYDAWRAGSFTGMRRAAGRRLHPRRRRDEERAYRAEAADLLRSVHLPDAAATLRRYPYTLSGGMLQRAMLATAIAGRPELLIADEPTTALDVTVQAHIVDLLRTLRDSLDLSVLFITHDLGLVAELCDSVVVMYAGRVVERAPVRRIFQAPRHPYTRALLAAMPSVERPDAQLAAIEGAVPRLAGLPPDACHFASRCPFASDICHRERPAMTEVDGELVACHLFSRPGLFPAPRARLAELTREPREPRVAAARRAPIDDGAPLVEAVDLSRWFAGVRTRSLGEKPTVRAVDGVSFSIRRGETLALVGESGCGKTTLGEVLVRLQPSSGGTLRWFGAEVKGAVSERAFRRRVQVVFQNPRASLDPRMTVGQIVSEQCLAQREALSKERLAALLVRVGLHEDMVGRYPHELSGGEAQRVAIARALAPNPEFLLLDEPTSALDVSVQAQILNLLRGLQAELSLTYLLISHDLRVVRTIADRVAVMYLGRIVEVADTRELYADPRHPYTRALLSSIPRGHPGVEQERIVLSGDVPSPAAVPSGCRFRTRCPWAVARCEVDPPLRTIGSDRWAACHFADQPAVIGAADAQPDHSYGQVKTQI